MQLKNIFKSIVRNLFGIVFFYGGIFHIIRFYNNLIGKRLTILTYHRVTKSDIQQIRNSLPYLFINENMFSEHLRFLMRFYNVISFQNLSKFRKNNNLPWNSMIISFDDGYEDNYFNAYPLLTKYKLPATIFIVVNSIGNDNLNTFWWDRAFFYFNNLEDLEENGLLPELDKNILNLFRKFKRNPSILFSQLNKMGTKQIEGILDVLHDEFVISNEDFFIKNRMLCWQQIHAMKNIEVGSHTCNHHNLIDSDDTKILYEIKGSMKFIEGKTGKKVRVFSYPGGNFNEDIQKFVKDAGYEFAVTTKTGINDMSDLLALRRINIWEGTARSSINGKFLKGYFALKLLGF